MNGLVFDTTEEADETLTLTSDITRGDLDSFPLVEDRTLLIDCGNRVERLGMVTLKLETEGGFPLVTARRDFGEATEIGLKLRPGDFPERGDYRLTVFHRSAGAQAHLITLVIEVD